VSFAEELDAEVKVLKIRIRQGSERQIRDQAEYVRKIIHDNLIDPCTYTYSHTRNVCGRDSCRES